MTPAQLAEIHAACFTAPRPWTAPEFQDLLNQRGVFLCEAPGGFLIGREAGGEAELLTLAVHPDAQRQGLGARLVMDFMAEAKAKGADHLFLEVAETNVAAIALYRKTGFTEAGYRRDYYNGAKGQKIGALVLHRAAPAN
jgi:ribosomal-protein-alanine N-acetyltransferase